MSKFSGLCLEEDGRNQVFVFKAGIRVLFEGKYLVNFNSEVLLNSVRVHSAPGKIMITLQLLGQFLRLLDQNDSHSLAILLIEAIGPKNRKLAVLP